MHGSTFGGNYLAMAVGKAVFDTINQPDFLTHVTKQGRNLRQMLQGLCQKFPDVIAQVRGRGLMQAVALCDDYKNSDLIARFHENEFLAVSAAGNSIRFLPPLIIDDAHIAQARHKITTSLESLQPCAR